MESQNTVSQSTKGFVVVKTNPTTSLPAPIPKYPIVENFKKDLRDAEFFQLDSKTIDELKDFLPQNLRGGEIASAFQLYSRGVKATELAEKTKTSSFLKEGERETLYNTAYLIEVLENANIPEIPKPEVLYSASFKPEVSIYESPFAVAPQANQISFEKKGSFLDPILQEAQGRAADFAKDKLKNIATKAIKSGGEKLLSQGSKVVAQTAIKIGTKAVTTVAGKATGAAIGAAVGTLIPIPILGQAIGAAAGWLLEKAGKLLKPIFRGIKKILSVITREKDFRKQVAYLGLAGAVIGLGMGILPLAIVSGAIGLGSLALITSGAVVTSGFIASVSAAMAAFFSITLMSIIGPILIALVVIPVSIALILFIINSGAYVVPPGGFGTTAGQLNQEDLVCNNYQGHRYCFPVVPVPAVLATCSHHDYVATDINTVSRTYGVPIVVAFTSGQILYAGGDDPLAGNAIIQLGDDNYIYSYFHLATTQVAAGSRVSAGQQIATQGSSGNAAGTPMTHFQIMNRSFCPYPNALAACASTYDGACLVAGGTRTECVLPYVDHFTCPSRAFNLIFGGTISCGPDFGNVGCGGPPPAATCYGRPECTQEPFSP